MSLSASLPDVQCPLPDSSIPYRPSTPETQHALSAVLKAHPREHLCRLDQASGGVQIGYWRRGLGLFGPNHFVAVGAGRSMDEAVLAAARGTTHPN